MQKKSIKNIIYYELFGIRGLDTKGQHIYIYLMLLHIVKAVELKLIDRLHNASQVPASRVSEVLGLPAGWGIYCSHLSTTWISTNQQLASTTPTKCISPSTLAGKVLKIPEDTLSTHFFLHKLLAADSITRWLAICRIASSLLKITRILERSQQSCAQQP